MKPFKSRDRAGKATLLLSLLLFLSPLTGFSEIKVKRVSAEYRNEEQFYRISEYFTKRENNGRDIVLRSRNESRGGYYLTVRLNKYPYQNEIVPEAIRLQIILPGDIEPTLFTFPLGPAKKRNPLLLIGLSGEDWPNPKQFPLAWHLGFHNSNGELIAETSSFLWSIED